MNEGIFMVFSVDIEFVPTARLKVTLLGGTDPVRQWRKTGTTDLGSIWNMDL